MRGIAYLGRGACIVLFACGDGPLATGDSGLPDSAHDSGVGSDAAPLDTASADAGDTGMDAASDGRTSDGPPVFDVFYDPLSVDGVITDTGANDAHGDTSVLDGGPGDGGVADAGALDAPSDAVGDATTASLVRPPNLPATICSRASLPDLEVTGDSTVTIDSRVGCDERITQTTGPEICIRRFRRITVDPAARIDARATAAGAPALALVAIESVIVRGVIDVSARDDGDPTTIDEPLDGPGSQRAAALFQLDAPSHSGAGGGGHGARGAEGGPGAFLSSGGQGGPAEGTDEVVPLVGGRAGGRAIDAATARASFGGGGGGALELVGCESVEIAATGVIVASGGGGSAGPGLPHRPATALDPGIGVGGGGGGAGGAIILVGRTVTVAGSLAANGGGGGSGGAMGSDSTPGSAGTGGDRGRVSIDAASGGAGLVPDGSPGGSGSSRSSPNAGAGLGATIQFAAAGGGGGFGRIRILTTGAPAIAPTAIVSPVASVGVAVVE